jgi:hypothetical protein
LSALTSTSSFAAPPSAISAASAYPEPVQQAVRRILPAQSRIAQHAPDVQLRDKGQKQRKQDHKPEARAERAREHGTVCVRKPGPMADVAIRNAAPISVPRLVSLRIFLSSCSDQ